MKNRIIYRKILIEKFIPPTEIDSNRTMRWKNEYGELHSINGQPSIIYTSGDKYWYKNGQLHRDGDKPAAIWLNGSKYWYKNGKFIKEEIKK